MKISSASYYRGQPRPTIFWRHYVRAKVCEQFIRITWESYGMMACWNCYLPFVMHEERDDMTYKRASSPWSKRQINTMALGKERHTREQPQSFLITRSQKQAQLNSRIRWVLVDTGGVYFLLHNKNAWPRNRRDLEHCLIPRPKFSHWQPTRIFLP